MLISTAALETLLFFIIMT